MNTATAARAPARQAGRMSLGAVRSGKRRAPDRILLVGTEGVGKSSWAAAAPAPIFIAAEGGINHLDVKSFPEPENYVDVIEALDVLATEPHDHKTLVVDTVDWLEALIWRHVCTANKWDSIESPGYGKGYAVALDEWRVFINALAKLRADRGMEIVLLAHASIKTFSNPAGADYSRYEVKLHRGAAALLKEWTDSNLFAMHEEFVKVTQKESANRAASGKGISTGRRVVKTERTTAWDAKSRWGLPPELPLNYADYAEARERGFMAGTGATPEALRTEATALLAELAPEPAKRTEIEGHINTNQNNAAMLAKIVDRLRTLVAEKE